MPRMRITQSVATERGSYQEGDEVTMSAREAQLAVEGGFADPVRAERPETPERKARPAAVPETPER